ncbi:MAG: DUF1552 domain-containing protein [Myxococcaceae bacterium]|nr:DUF1552 domain-containing protein [Myxococcaceae bacterium]
MAKLSLSRRDVIRGAGTIAIALPWLEAMRPAPAAAQTTSQFAQRFLSVYTPGGTVMANWRPTGSTSAPVLSTILAPLQPHLDKVLILDGLAMLSARGEQHQGGNIAWLTGTEQDANPNRYAAGPSIDQLIATRISKDKKRISSLQMAVRWATGNSNSRLGPQNCCTYADNATFDPIAPRLDPQAIWTECFGSLNPTNAEQAKRDRKKSVLDYTDKRYAALSNQLGVDDKRRLDQHLTEIRRLETRLDQLPPVVPTCVAPARVDTAGYNPGLGTTMSLTTDQQIPAVGTFMMDMMVMAFACDLTAVGHFQWTDTEAKHTYPWLGLNEHLHFYEHDGGFQPVQLTQVYTWYHRQHAYLLNKMKGIEMAPGRTLLDESVVFFGSELQDPPSHDKRNMPFLLAGGGGGLRGGRWLRYGNDLSHNNLLVAILNLFGDMRTSLGPAQYNTTRITNLTV